MPLSALRWRECSIDYVIEAFLVAEREKSSTGPNAYTPNILRLIDAPNFNSVEENAWRRRLLYLTRRHLMGEIPTDTRWYQVARLEREHLPELLVIGRAGWDAPATEPQDGNRLLSVTERHRRELKSDPSTWKGIILWGHSRKGPFSILEGNNRLVAYASSDSASAIPEVLVGISNSNCLWHLPDLNIPIATDLWR